MIHPWREQGKALLLEAQATFRVLRHPGTPWRARLVAAATVGYLVSPVQLIPSFIPVIGQMDDVAVLAAGSRLLRRLTPAPILAECHTAPAAHRRLCHATAV